MNYDKQFAVYSRDGIQLDIGSKCGSVTGLHSHDDEYQLEVLLHGESHSLFKKKQEKILPGIIDVYNPTDLHEVDYRSTESLIFHLKIDVVKKIYSEMGLCYQQPVFDSTLRKKIQIPLSFLAHEMTLLKDLKEISQLNSTIEIYQESKVFTLLRLMLGEIGNVNEFLSTVDPCSQNKVKKAQKWIKENFYQEDISISRLAKLSHLSKFHFIRVFKNVYGKTPYDYLMETRVKEAVKILKGKKYRNKEEVSLSVGLKNAAQLRYHLKKIMAVGKNSLSTRSKRAIRKGD